VRLGVILLFSGQLAVRAMPIFGNPDEFRITVSPDKVQRLPVFFVFRSGLVLKSADDVAGGVVDTVGAGLQAAVPETAEFDPAPGPVDITLAISISKLAATANAARLRSAAGLTVRTAAANL